MCRIFQDGWRDCGGFVRCTTKKYENKCCLGFMVCKGLSAAIRKTCAFRLKQDGQDYQDGQDESAKVWKTLMSIARRSNQEKRSVRTLIAIDTLAPIVFGGEGLSSCLSCLSWPS